ncbi:MULTISPECIES: hypothetical protein [Niastella]|uniref:Peptidase M12A domain-containing protein n=1 Tax=Niastella soli TaxID=2821487 RepID=A0ABS3Z394_9BACT|nr:hypothetical protein [Niastella soli]MBO9204634.1 hypothetical protein [Niastella soli]
MIAFFRVRWPDTPAKQVWSDTVATNWLNPAIPFSLAHYWKVSTFQQADMSNVVFPPLIINNPGVDRDQLVYAVLAAAEQAFHPTWSQFDRCIIYFAQHTDLFGGGPYQTADGNHLMAAVFDIESTFDLACQEVGHTFGLCHELDKTTNEYQCPYSVMSALTTDLWFTRTLNPNLPGADRPENPQNRVGPYIPTAHLYINQYNPINPHGVFNHPDTVSYITTTYEYTPVNVRLYARDVAIAAWPNRRTVLAVVPPIVPGGDTYFLELRRRDNSYDHGIGNTSIIILSANFFAWNPCMFATNTPRLHYIDRIDMEDVKGDLDYHSFNGRFVIRVNNFAPDLSWANISIGGGNAWQNFRLLFEEQLNDTQLIASGDWKRGLIAPCPIELKRVFRYRTKTYHTFFVLRARSIGYEAPGYSWKLQNVLLTPADNSITLQVSCRDHTGQNLNSPSLHPVDCQYAVNSGRLELTVLSPFAGITLDLEVVVAETSPSVMKNYYPSRTLQTTVHANNLGIEWDDDYKAASAACWKRFQSAFDQIPKFELPHPNPGDPGPDYFEKIGIREVIRFLAARDPQAARAVAAIIADKAAVSIEQVMEAALRNTRLLPGKTGRY